MAINREYQLYVYHCFNGSLMGFNGELMYYSLLAAINGALSFLLIGLIRLIRPICPIGPKSSLFLSEVFSRPLFLREKFHLRRILAHTCSTFAA